MNAAEKHILRLRSVKRRDRVVLQRKSPQMQRTTKETARKYRSRLLNNPLRTVLGA